MYNAFTVARICCGSQVPATNALQAIATPNRYVLQLYSITLLIHGKHTKIGHAVLHTRARTYNKILFLGHKHDRALKLSSIEHVASIFEYEAETVRGDAVSRFDDFIRPSSTHVL